MSPLRKHEKQLLNRFLPWKLPVEEPKTPPRPWTAPPPSLNKVHHRGTPAATHEEPSEAGRAPASRAISAPPKGGSSQEGETGSGLWGPPLKNTRRPALPLKAQTPPTTSMPVIVIDDSPEPVQPQKPKIRILENRLIRPATQGCKSATTSAPMQLQEALLERYGPNPVEASPSHYICLDTSPLPRTPTTRRAPRTPTTPESRAEEMEGSCGRPSSTLPPPDCRDDGGERPKVRGIKDCVLCIFCFHIFLP